jgi:hypothetical protein
VLETKLDNRHSIKIPHNRINKILKDHKLVSNGNKKQGEESGPNTKEDIV